jgi:hypothetical protein
VANNALSAISKPRASCSDIARQWLVKFGEICQREVTPALAQIWDKQLCDIPPDLLERACNQVAKTWTSSFLPTPGNIRAVIDQADARGFDLKAEEAWQFALEYCTRSYHPDVGVSRCAPELPTAIEHAIRAAGGIHFIYNCSDEQLVWAKKRFTEDFATVHEMSNDERLLTDGEARGILRRITAAPRRARELTAPATRETETPDKAEVVAAFAALREKLNQPETTPTHLSDEDLDRRKRAELARFNRHIQDQPALAQLAEGQKPRPQTSSPTDPKASNFGSALHEDKND